MIGKGVSNPKVESSLHTKKNSWELCQLLLKTEAKKVN